MNYCDDGGACHHNCADRSGKCYRRQCCEPLSNVFPNDEWPPPSGAEVHGTDPTLKPTPTPSITVGTQVRLTGVVLRAWPEGGLEVEVEGAPGRKVTISEKQLEVIRQPFKRGEVVYHLCLLASPPFVVVNDEVDGTVDVTNCQSGDFAKANLAKDFERRP